jgi:hypothetical protein
VPFLVYLAVALEVKNELSMQDILLVTSSLIMVLNGAFVSFGLFPYSAILISLFCYFAMIFIQLYEQRKQSKLRKQEVNEND